MKGGPERAAVCEPGWMSGTAGVAAGAATDPTPTKPRQGTGLNGSDMTVLRISLQKNIT